ncbi:hypothetical protein XENOCAPTIV_003336, partial [Xenoophorus captivus]
MFIVTLVLHLRRVSGRRHADGGKGTLLVTSEDLQTHSGLLSLEQSPPQTASSSAVYFLIPIIFL